MDIVSQERVKTRKLKKTILGKKPFNLIFLENRKSICKKLNDCSMCELKEACHNVSEKKYIELKPDEWNAYKKHLDSCEKSRGDCCDKCKSRKRCYTLFIKITDWSPIFSEADIVEFDGIQGYTNPCVEGYEESIASLLNAKGGVFGLSSFYSNSGIKFEESNV